MFQFTYKLKVAERVKAKCERHPRYNPEREGRGGIKGGCSTCSLYLTYIRRGYRLMPHIGSFCEERRRGLTYVSHATGQTHRGRKILHLEANLSNSRGCVRNPTLRKKMPPKVSKSAPLISLRE